MVGTVDVIFHYGGKWEVRENDELYYVNGDIDMIYNFDPDYMCYKDILYQYQKTLGYTNAKKIFVLEPGKNWGMGYF